LRRDAASGSLVYVGYLNARSLPLENFKQAARVIPLCDRHRNASSPKPRTFNTGNARSVTMRKYLLAVFVIIAGTIIAAETAEPALDANGNTAKILIPNIEDHFSIEEDD
jgi:hypothetical protein